MKVEVLCSFSFQGIRTHSRITIFSGLSIPNLEAIVDPYGERCSGVSLSGSPDQSSLVTWLAQYDWLRTTSTFHVRNIDQGISSTDIPCREQQPIIPTSDFLHSQGVCHLWSAQTPMQ